MRVLNRTAFATGVSFLLLGCAATKELPTYECGVSKAEVISRIDTARLADLMAQDLCPLTGEGGVANFESSFPIVVPDVVDVQTLMPDSLGIAMGELLRNSVFRVCKLPVRQVELSQQFRLNPNGFMALTRDHAEVREQNIPADTAMIGTYHLQSNKLTVAARRVALQESTIIAVSSKEVTWKCERSLIGTTKFSWEIK